MTSDWWNTVKAEFQGLFPHDVYTTWFEPLRCMQQGEACVDLGAPNEFAAIWIKDNYQDLLNRHFESVADGPVEVRIQVFEDEPVRESTTPRGAADGSSQASGRNIQRRSHSQNASGKSIPVLNERNTFENFVVGAGNELAHAASIAVANAPAKAYNPLFLYGATGLGKTHLMHAVAHQILRNKPDASIAYISTEKFTNAYVKAIESKSITQFRQHYRQVDVILIDDVHFLSNKERIQEEFFHTFNELFESQKQIFLSSDRPASEIAKLESRLVSRFQWGMVADIQPPDFETRLAILTKKARVMNLELQPSILEFLAERVSRNVRRMEGALTRVAGYAALTHKAIDIEVIEKLLADILQEEARDQITLEKIQQKVADYFKLRITDMLSRQRPNRIAFPRQIAMYLCRVLTSQSLQDIGEAFGGRDHGTVIYACKTVEAIMEQDPSVSRSVDYLRKQLSAK